MLTNITLAAPVAPWLGGKRNLAKRICTIIDATPCVTYVEPFVGMGGVFLRRSTRPRVEVINDRAKDIVNLFRILQRHYPQCLDSLRFQLTTRAEFERLVRVDPEMLTDLERAARFLYLQRSAFGGKVSGRNFGVAKERPGWFNLTTLAPILEDLHSRLTGVVIKCLDWGARTAPTPCSISAHPIGDDLSWACFTGPIRVSPASCRSSCQTTRTISRSCRSLCQYPRGEIQST